MHYQIQASIQQVARVACGCHINSSYAYDPAYLEELFGPVIRIIRVNSLEEAVFVANDNEPQAQHEAKHLPLNVNAELY